MPFSSVAAGLVGAAGVNITPNSSGLPGISALEKIVGSLIVVAVIAAVAGILVSAAVWAIGNHSSNPHRVSQGKTGVVVGAIAAVLAGGAMVLVNFFFNIGQAL